MQIYQTIAEAIAATALHFKTYGRKHTTQSWQGIKKEIEMFEVTNVYFRANMPQYVTFMKFLIQPSLPWADIHFQERIGGQPLNPGESYKEWPFYKDSKFNDTHFRNQNEKFSHTYMERYWPKRAGFFDDPENPRVGAAGIRYDYGDLNDIIELLKREPDTRQAYLPVWFPEDTGSIHGGRVPCTLGYHFMLRDGKLHVHYTIRACDWIRHFRNDIYLTMRLANYILGTLIKSNHPSWQGVELGIFTMDIISLHVFYQERNLI